MRGRLAAAPHNQWSFPLGLAEADAAPARAPDRLGVHLLVEEPRSPVRGAGGPPDGQWVESDVGVVAPAIDRSRGRVVEGRAREEGEARSDHAQRVSWLAARAPNARLVRADPGGQGRVPTEEDLLRGVRRDSRVPVV